MPMWNWCTYLKRKKIIVNKSNRVKLVYWALTIYLFLAISIHWISNGFKVHIMQLDQIRFGKSPFYFWPIIRFFCVSCPIFFFQYMMPGSQSWNFIHWDQTNPSKVYRFLDADKFVLFFMLISNKKQLCRM